MSRVEENREVITRIYDMYNNAEFGNDEIWYESTVPLVLIDISKSLAIIADAIKKE